MHAEKISIELRNFSDVSSASSIANATGSNRYNEDIPVLARIFTRLAEARTRDKLPRFSHKLRQERFLHSSNIFKLSVHYLQPYN